MPPMESPRTYDSWYECSIAANRESKAILQKMGYADVNKYKVGTKYVCRLDQTL
jgi:hypothetical protein